MLQSNLNLPPPRCCHRVPARPSSSGNFCPTSRTRPANNPSCDLYCMVPGPRNLAPQRAAALRTTHLKRWPGQARHPREVCAKATKQYVPLNARPSTGKGDPQRHACPCQDHPATARARFAASAVGPRPPFPIVNSRPVRPGPPGPPLYRNPRRAIMYKNPKSDRAPKTPPRTDMPIDAAALRRDLGPPVAANPNPNEMRR